MTKAHRRNLIAMTIILVTVSFGLLQGPDMGVGPIAYLGGVVAIVALSMLSVMWLWRRLPGIARGSILAAIPAYLALHIAAIHLGWPLYAGWLWDAMLIVHFVWVGFAIGLFCMGIYHLLSVVLRWFGLLPPDIDAASLQRTFL